MIVFTTLNSTYELDDVSFTCTLRRVPNAEPLRRDNEHIKVLKVMNLSVGERAEFLLDLREDGVPTFRSTSEVLEIKEKDK